MPASADHKISSSHLPSKLDELSRDTVSTPLPSWPPAPARRWRSGYVSLIIVGLALLAVRTFVAEISIVPTGSMEGTILVGDHLFLNKLPYGPEIPLSTLHLPRWKAVYRGQIVVFRYPRNPNEAFVKRVIAVGGDRIAIRDGVVYLNSSVLEEPYAIHRSPTQARDEQMPQVTVPPGSLFVMGDNRDNSSDSREWGLVPERNVIGEPLFVYWSYDAPSSRWLDSDPGHQVEFDISIAANFFSHTRWIRMGTLLQPSTSIH